MRKLSWALLALGAVAVLSAHGTPVTSTSGSAATPTAVASTLLPTNTASLPPNVSVSPAGAYYYQVQRNDTIWSIAKRFLPAVPTVDEYQVIAAIYRSNPQAFLHGDVNLLQQVRLTIPPLEVMAQEKQQTGIDLLRGKIRALPSLESRRAPAPKRLTALQEKAQAQTLTPPVVGARIDEAVAVAPLLHAKPQAQELLADEVKTLKQRLADEIFKLQQAKAQLQDEVNALQAKMARMQQQSQAQEGQLKALEQQLTKLQTQRPPLVPSGALLWILLSISLTTLILVVLLFSVKLCKRKLRKLPPSKELSSMTSVQQTAKDEVAHPATNVSLNASTTQEAAGQTKPPVTPAPSAAVETSGPSVVTPATADCQGKPQLTSSSKPRSKRTVELMEVVNWTVPPEDDFVPVLSKTPLAQAPARKHQLPSTASPSQLSSLGNRRRTQRTLQANLNLAELNFKAGKLNEAQALLQALKASGDARFARRAQELEQRYVK